MCYTFTAPFTISFITYMADISLFPLVSRVAFHDLTEHHVLPVEPTVMKNLPRCHATFFGQQMTKWCP